MSCEICGRTPESLVILPKKQPDGRLNTIACESCSVESGLYCQKHRRPHLGFEDETTACIDCIEETLAKDGERLAGIFAVAVSQSAKEAEIKEALDEWLGEINLMLSNTNLAELPLAAKFVKTPYALNVTRTIITYAQRKKISPEEVIKKVAEEGPGVILPWYH